MQQIEIFNSRKEKLILKIVLYLTIGCCPHEIMKIKAERQLDCNWRGDKNQGGMALRRTSLHADQNSLLEKETTATGVKMAAIAVDLHIPEVTICIPAVSATIQLESIQSGYG